VAPRQVDRDAERGEPVAVAAVDRSLRRPEGRERLAAAAHVVELGAHQRGQDAAPPVGRQHADDRDAGAVELAARYREPKRKRPRATDHASLVEGSVHAVERQVAVEPLRALPVGPAAEVVPDRADGSLELVEVLGGPNLDAHQAIFSNGA